MAIEFKLPELGEGVESADVAEILVAEGDEIEAEQIVLELETEKAVAELPCPHAGKITKIHVSEGDTVSVGTTLFTIEESAAAEKEQAETKAQPAEQPAEKAEQAEKKQEAEQVEEAEAAPAAEREEEERKPREAARRPEPATAAVGTTAAARTAEAKAPPAAGREEFEVPPPAGPSTRRMARELGVDLRRVSGSGPGNRITPEDVQAYVRSLTSGNGAAAGPAAAPPLPDFSKFGPVERQKLNKIARSSASNLSLSWQLIPHVTQHDLADITELEAARKRLVERIGSSGPKVTMTAIVIKAAVAALKAFPHVNSSIDMQAGELILKNYYHIGVAVDTPSGLLVPVIRDADRKSILEVAGELADIAERARNRKLDLSEMQGATFTITNLGGIGGTGFTPIVNYPEVAILGMSRSREELQLIDGQLETRLMLPLSFSYDHRVVNGADAARFTVKLCRLLSDSFSLLVEC